MLAHPIEVAAGDEPVPMHGNVRADEGVGRAEQVLDGGGLHGGLQRRDDIGAGAGRAPD